MPMRTKDRSPSLGEFEIFVMSAIIAASSDSYGVTVHEQVEKLTGRDVAQGAVYTTLMRLEEKGLVRSWLGEASPERGGKAKRFYSVEAAGQRSLRAALTSMHRASRAIGLTGVTFNDSGWRL